MKTNLHELRTQSNKSLQEVADYLGITKQTLSNYERGTREPNIDTIKQLAIYYGVDLNTLLNFDLKNIQNIQDFKSETLKEKLNYLVESRKFKRINVYPMGTSLPLDSNKYVDYEDIPRFWMKDESEYFGIRVVDNRFEPLISKDRNLIVKVTNRFNENDILVININGKTHLFSVIILSRCPYFYNLASKDVIDIEDENPDFIQFIGRVIEVRQKVSNHTDDSVVFTIAREEKKYNITAKKGFSQD